MPVLVCFAIPTWPDSDVNSSVWPLTVGKSVRPLRPTGICNNDAVAVASETMPIRLIPTPNQMHLSLFDALDQSRRNSRNQNAVDANLQ